VVVVMLAPNDLQDDLLFERSVGFDFDSDGIPIAPRAKLQLWLLQKSYVLRYLNVALSRVSPRVADFFFPLATPGLTAPDWTDLLCRSNPAVQALFRNKTGHYLERLKQMSKAAGAEFAVDLIHYKYVFADEPIYEPRYPGLRRSLETNGCYSSGGKYYNEFIEDFMKEKGITFSNPYERFVKAKGEHPKQQMWLFWDYHYSTAGHLVAADDLYELVRPMLQ